MGYTKTMKHLDFGEWIPENVEEARNKFIELYAHLPHGKIVVDVMTGILRCRLEQGEEFIQAYKNTLYDFLKTPENERH
jgi:hypothetical protein